MTRTPQLTCAALALALTAAACSREETGQQAQRAAAEIKTAAAKAGDTLEDGLTTTRIQAKYFADDQVKARYIDVSTSNGIVTLKGYVDSPQARERALDIARATEGVKQVDDQLLIGQAPAAVSGSQQPVATSGRAESGSHESAAGDAAGNPGGAVAKIDDARVTTMIQAKYFLDSTVKGRRIDVDTRGGVVTLSGDVASDAERAQALRLARATDGVQRVEDHLTVNAALPAAQSR